MASAVVQQGELTKKRFYFSVVCEDCDPIPPSESLCNCGESPFKVTRVYIVSTMPVRDSIPVVIDGHKTVIENVSEYGVRHGTLMGIIREACTMIYVFDPASNTLNGLFQRPTRQCNPTFCVYNCDSGTFVEGFLPFLDSIDVHYSPVEYTSTTHPDLCWENIEVEGCYTSEVLTSMKNIDVDTEDDPTCSIWYSSPPFSFPASIVEG